MNTSPEFLAAKVRLNAVLGWDEPKCYHALRLTACCTRRKMNEVSRAVLGSTHPFLVIPHRVLVRLRRWEARQKEIT